MTQTTSTRAPHVDWITVVAIAAIAISLNVAVHEGVHALACIAVGGHLQEFSALYVSCGSLTAFQGILVDGSAPTFNLIAGALLWVTVRNPRKQTAEVWFFLWLLMLMNWLYGSGYWMFSGIANVGDMATMIRGWEPNWFWRVLMTLAGALFFLVFVWLALQEFGKMIGGAADEQIRRASKLAHLSYAASVVVTVMAGFFSPLGFLSLPGTAGLFAVMGGLSPLLWMMQWFRAKSFVKLEKQALEIDRKWQWLMAGAAVATVYVLVLGRTLYF